MSDSTGSPTSMATSLLKVEASSELSASNRGTSPTKTLFDDPDADIILRSRDDLDCRVQKTFLVKGSPLLDGLIQDASGHSSAIPVGSKDALPVVQLSERGAILYHLLTFLLPITPVLPPTLEETMELLSVAQKYDLNHALVRIRGSVALKDPPLVDKKNALHVYSLAQKYGLRREVVQAARITLKSPLTIDDLQGKLDLMSGDNLYELWGYHQRVQANLTKNIKEFRASDAYALLKCLDGATPGKKRTWIDDFIFSMASDPSLFDLPEFQSALARHVCYVPFVPTAKRGCLSCAYLPTRAIDEFWTALATFVHANMEKAESEFSIPRRNMHSQNPNSSTTATLPLPECLEVSDADIVLQSSDSANFQVHKSILASSSQFFKDMLSLPQPSSNETIGGLPVVRLSEDAEIVRALITVLYPIPSEIPSSYEKVLALLGAAQKYDMSAVQPTIRADVHYKVLQAPTQTFKAFRAYAIAFSNGLSYETKSAAYFTLDYSLTFEALGDDLPLFVGSALSVLADYRKVCRDSVVSCLESFLDVRNGPSKIWVGCPGSIAQNSLFKPLGKPPQGNIAVTPSVGSTISENDECTLPSWLHGLFTWQIVALKKSFTNSIIKPSSIREKYLAALRTHSPDKSGCIPCMVVHTHSGERYCVELEQRLTRARNKVFSFF